MKNPTPTSLEQVSALVCGYTTVICQSKSLLIACSVVILAEYMLMYRISYMLARHQAHIKDLQVIIFELSAGLIFASPAYHLTQAIATVFNKSMLINISTYQYTIPGSSNIDFFLSNLMCEGPPTHLFLEDLSKAKISAKEHQMIGAGRDANDWHMMCLDYRWLSF